MVIKNPLKPFLRRNKSFNQHEKIANPKVKDTTSIDEWDEAVEATQDSWVSTSSHTSSWLTQQPQQHQQQIQQHFFQDKLRQAYSDRRITQLIFKDFVELCNHQDMIQLKELLQDGKRHWQSIKFVDTLHAPNYLRRRFKRDGLWRAILPIVEQRHITIYKDCKLHIDLASGHSHNQHHNDSDDRISSLGVIHLLEQVQTDVDVTSLEITGWVDYHDILPIVTALIALLSKADRRWEGVVFHVTPLASAGEDQYMDGQRAWKRCTRALEDVCLKFNIPLGIVKTTC